MDRQGDYYRASTGFIWRGPKNLDPSYKMNLNHWNCFRKEKTNILAECHKIDADIWDRLEEGIDPSYNQNKYVYPIFILFTILFVTR